jgi:OFA family oxalate/formate antiporter-like MFS transporter
VASALAINLIIGALYAWGVFKKALVTDWHWSNTRAALPFTVSTIAFALTMIFAGRWQDKIGPRYVATLGGVFFGLGLMLSGYAHSPSMMVLTFGVIAGVGIGLGYSATTPPSIKWFPPARKGLITGIVVSGVGLAAVYNAPLTQYLLGYTHSISKTFVILGAGSLVLVCILAQFLQNPPPGYTGGAMSAPPSGKAPAGPAGASGRQLDWHEMLRTPQFYHLWVMFVLAASAGMMIIVHVGNIAKEQAKLAWGFLPIAVLALFNTSGRLLSGVVSDLFGRPKTMVAAFLLQAVNMFVFNFYRDPTSLLFASAFTGLCYGTIFTLFPATTADFYGVRNLGVNYGLMFTAFGVAGVVGPIVGGAIRDHFGAYSYAYIVSGVLLVVGALLALALRPVRLA